MKQKYVIITPIWGENYIIDFAKYTLPSILSKQNLPYLTNEAEVKYVIGTTTEDEALVRAMILPKIQNRCQVRIHSIDHIAAAFTRPHTPVHILNVAYQEMILAEYEVRRDVRFVLVNADFLFANSYFETMHGLMQRGVRAVMQPMFRCDSSVETFQEIEKYRDLANTLTFEPRDLVSFGMKSFHQTTIACMLHNTKGIGLPIQNHFYFSDPYEKYLIGYCYLMHPMAFTPDVSLRHWNGFVDYAMVPLFVSDKNKIYVPNSSDELLCLEYSRSDKDIEYLEPKKWTIKSFAKNLSVWTSDHHRFLAKQPFYWIGVGFDEVDGPLLDYAKNVMTEIEKDLREYPSAHPEGSVHWGDTLKKYLSIPGIERKAVLGDLNMPRLSVEPQFPEASAKSFCIVVVLWGRWHADLFTRVSLPILIADNSNTRELFSEKSKLLIATTLEDSFFIKASPIYEKTKNDISWEFLLCDGIVDENPINKMSKFHLEAISHVAGKYDTIFFLNPDSFIGPGGIRYVLDKVDGLQCKAAMALSIRLDAHKVMRELAASDGVEIIDENAFVRYFLKSLHPISKALNVFAKSFINEWPSHLYFITDEYFFAHAFHLHPLAIHGGALKKATFDSIDGNYVEKICKPREVEVVSDFKRVAFFELSPPEKFSEHMKGRFSRATFLNFAFLSATKRHRLYFRKKINVFESSPPPEEVVDLQRRLVSLVARPRLATLIYYLWMRIVREASRPKKFIIDKIAATRLYSISRALVKKIVS